MNVQCDDNRFDLIEKYKNKLTHGTNIEHCEDEMKVIDSILFRFWQIGWLDKIENRESEKERIIKKLEEATRIVIDAEGIGYIAVPKREAIEIVKRGGKE